MNPDQNYELKEKIGRGSFAIVYRAVERNSKKNVAIKLVDLNFGDVQIECIQGEINTLLECKCNNIIICHQAFLHESTLWIVMEYMEVGTLSDLIKMRTFKEFEIAVFCREIVTGLRYLHERGIIHRDIKSGNVLVSANGDIKLSDFGFSRTFTNTHNKFDTFVGTPLWMAPEIIKESEYNYKVDIWSVGITCVEMATGHPPLHNLHVMRALFLIPLRDPPKLPNMIFSTFIQQFIDLCLNKNPRDRPPASLLLRHSFLRKAKKKSVILPLIEKYLKIKKNKTINGSSNSPPTAKPTTLFEFDLSSPKTETPTTENSNDAKAENTTEDIIVDMEETITDQMRKSILTKLHQNSNKNEETNDSIQSQVWDDSMSFTWNEVEPVTINNDINEEIPEEIKNCVQRDLLKENEIFERLTKYMENENINQDLIEHFEDTLNECLNKNINFLHDFSLEVVHKLTPDEEVRYFTDL